MYKLRLVLAAVALVAFVLPPLGSMTGILQPATAYACPTGGSVCGG